MSEGSGVEMSPQNIQRNPVSEFVISKVSHYGELNAPTLQAADEKFTHKLISSLKGSTVRGEVSRGSQFLVNELTDNSDIVVKRLRAGIKTDKQGYRTIDEYWNDLQKDHELAERYFGRRFVPYTEFVVVDGTNFGDPSPNKFEVIPQKEYVMVQEKLSGEEITRLKLISPHYEFPTVTPQVKTELISFIKHYENMVGQEKLAPEEQIMINVSEGNVKLADTNYFRSFNNYMARAGAFLQAFGIDPQTIHTPEAIANIVRTLPGFEPLKNAEYEELVRACDRTPENWGQACDSLFEKYGQGEVLEGFKYLALAFQYFPPEGVHNSFIQSLMSKSGITQEDLTLTS